MTTPRYRWQPTTLEIAERFGLRPADVVRFDHNTSPFTTEWAAPIATPIAAHLNEYPGASYRPLRDAAASYLDTPVESVVPGAGVDEVILLIAKAFLGERKRATALTPTYPLYEIATRQVGAEFLSIPFDPPAFDVPTRALGEAAETSDVTWLCVPNNPTGHRIDDGEIEAVVRSARGIVVIDAAYAEFCHDHWAPWISRYDNVIVCTTMSKAFGLAALRVGFAMASPELAFAIDGVRPPGSIASVSAAVAESALRTPQRMERHVEHILRERSRFAEALSACGAAPMMDMATNFVLCEIGSVAHGVADDLMAEGLVVRRFPADGGLSRFLRFTVRSEQENARLIAALSQRIEARRHMG